MTDLFFYSRSVLALVFFLLICLFSLESGYLCVNLLNYRLKEKHLIIGDIFLLIHVAILILTMVTVIINSRYGVISLGNLDILLYISGIASGVSFAVLSIKKVQYSGLAVLAVILTLPISAELLQLGYIVFLLISILILFYRSINIIKKTLHRQKNELNAFSVMEGLNTLPCGVLFCDLSGYVFLINEKMSQLAIKYMDTQPKNGLLFWDNLQSFKSDSVYRQIVEGDILLRTSIGAWRFRKQQFTSGGVEYIEITAIDVRESIGAFYALEEENKKLASQSKEIEKLTENMEALRREREYSLIRSRVHDVLGQRLTAMQRIIQGDVEPDYDMLLLLSQDAIEQIKHRKGGNAKELFEEIYQYFYKIGLEIELLNPLPKEEQIAFLFLSVLREASTNAIKHAAATKVYCKINDNGKTYRMEITNNGHGPKKGLVEGGGLFGIRSRVENAGGVLKVEVIPEFSLIITIDRGNDNDKSIYS